MLTLIIPHKEDAFGGFRVLIRRNWGEHLPWIVFILAVSALSVFWYISIITATGWDARPTGSKGALFYFGIAGGSICLFEFLLWPRKKFRAVRIGKAQTWMRAHIWLGLLAVPLLILHSGFYFQNLEATVLFILFLVVIASGVWGLLLQQFIPQKMLDEVPAETIYSQIDHVSNLMVEEGDRLVAIVCGTAPVGQTKASPAITAARDEEAILAGIGDRGEYTVGAVRTVGGAQGRGLQAPAWAQPVPESGPLRDFFHAELADYLKRGKVSGSSLADAPKAKARFAELRAKLSPAAHPAVEALEGLTDQRRQMDRQASLHFWLHSWLWVHLPLSAALIILMFVHVFVTLRYRWPS
jgi:hypothetical protein